VDQSHPAGAAVRGQARGCPSCWWDPPHPLGAEVTGRQPGSGTPASRSQGFSQIWLIGQAALCQKLLG